MKPVFCFMTAEFFREWRRRKRGDPNLNESTDKWSGGERTLVSRNREKIVPTRSARDNDTHTHKIKQVRK
jgi:hypothetical protein